MILTVLAAALGLLAGPFLRRLVDQIPGRDPLFDPPARELVPVGSWFQPEPAGARVLIGSPDDREPDAAESVVRRWRAPIIDVSAAAVLAVVAHRIGWNWALPAFLVFGAALVVATVIDLDHFRIPDRVVFPALAFCLPVLVLAAILHDVPGALGAAVAGAVGYFAFLFVFFFIWPRGLGFGDVKLALLLGLHLGWAGSLVAVDGVLVHRGVEWGLQLVLMGALLGSVLGALAGIGMMAASRRRAAFPFGPALCLGALVAIVFSASVLG